MPRPRAGAVGQTARVVSAFVSAFGKRLLEKTPPHLALGARSQAVAPGVSLLWAQNARLVMEEGIALLLDHLSAEIHMRDPQAPLVPEQRDAFSFHIRRGHLAMDEASVSTLLNRYACPPGSPLSHVSLHFLEGSLRMDATLKFNRFIGVGLRLEAVVGATPEGLLELTPTRLRSGPLPLDRMLHALGLELARFMPAQEGAPMRVQGDRILLDPVGMLPAPRATGHLVEATVRGEHLVMRYDDQGPETQPPLLRPDAEAYLAMLGHDLRVGKTLMKDVCVQLVPLDPLAQWVEFSLPDYRAQLAAGESSLLPGDEVLYKLPEVASLKGR